MSEDSPELDPPHSFSSSAAEEEIPPLGDDEEGAAGAIPGSASMALDVGRMWVRTHQKESMLGAFAVGVFVGVLLRD